MARKYWIVFTLAWIAIILWGVTAVREPGRLAFSASEREAILLDRGAQLYAANCASCHGPAGEGVVGPALLREGFQGNPDENTEIYDLIYNAIDLGRPGTSDPHWVKLSDGSWASFTAMPTWGKANGGPLNELEIEELTRFIMAGNFGLASKYMPKPRLAYADEAETQMDPQGTADMMLDAVGLTDAENEKAKEIFITKSCVQCHTVGAAGGVVGPDLSRAGAWGMDEEFLKQWISDPQNTPNRAPTHWSNYGGPVFEYLTQGAPSAQNVSGSAAEDPSTGAPNLIESIGEGTALGPTTMPKIPMEPEELDLLVKYLLGLK